MCKETKEDSHGMKMDGKQHSACLCFFIISFTFSVFRHLLMPIVSESRKPLMEQQLDNLACKFFKLFAKYESSLKEKDFFQASTNGKISVDWDRFANEVIE